MTATIILPRQSGAPRTLWDGRGLGSIATPFEDSETCHTGVKAEQASHLARKRWRFNAVARQLASFISRGYVTLIVTRLFADCLMLDTVFPNGSLCVCPA